MKNIYKKALELFFVFFKIGAITFGGGYAMISIMHRDVVEKKGWVTDEQMTDMIAVSESTPGPIAVNIATFVGYRVCGAFGAFMATLGVVLPSFAVISVISLFLAQFKQLQFVKYAFMGIRAGIVVLIINAVFKIAKGIKIDYFSVIIITAAFCSVVFFNLSVIVAIIMSGLLGLVYQLVMHRKSKEKNI